MGEPIPSELLALEQDYPVRVARENGQIVVHADSISAELWLDIYDNGSCIFGDTTWHEHADDVASAAEFLRRLFVGDVQLEIIYRGDDPMGHRLLERGPAGMTPTRSTSGCLTPFWRPKSGRVLDYCLLTSAST